jgi:hypothetical protein
LIELLYRFTGMLLVQAYWRWAQGNPPLSAVSAAAFVAGRAQYAELLNSLVESLHARLLLPSSVVAAALAVHFYLRHTGLALAGLQPSIADSLFWYCAQLAIPHLLFLYMRKARPGSATAATPPSTTCTRAESPASARTAQQLGVDMAGKDVSSSAGAPTGQAAASSTGAKQQAADDDLAAMQLHSRSRDDKTASPAEQPFNQDVAEKAGAHTGPPAPGGMHSSFQEPAAQMMSGG